jgi:4-diphosphocytidyl-2-C-methyl-D-erythritol kinase
MIFGPAFAKLNLALSVVGRRADGRHDLRSVVVHLDWHDMVGVGIQAGGGVRLTVSGPGAGEVPGDGSNLAVRAATAVLASLPGRGLRLHLEKRLPAAAGVGGGSADAAAVLHLLRGQLMGGAFGEADLLDLGDRLGSDVPACLVGGSLLVGGAGERLEALHHPAFHLAVAVTGASSTAATFAALAPHEWRGPDRPEALGRAMAAGGAPNAELCGSDLEAAACRANPELGQALTVLREGVPEVTWHLTGSGGACFALAADAAHAVRLAEAACAHGFPARHCRTVSAVYARPLAAAPPHLS